MSSKLQNIFALLGIVVLAVLGYYLFIQDAELSLQNTSVNNQVAVETSEFLGKLSEIKAITLEGAIFKDSRFNTLLDSSQTVVPVPVGRTNPFTASN